MPSRKLPNYLRTFRKRSGLSQDEVAFLLGSPTGGMISRYEQFNRSPSLETACALVALFGVPGKELFAGMFERVKQQLGTRAQILEKRLKGADALTMRKRTMLQSVTQAPLNASL